MMNRYLLSLVGGLLFCTNPADKAERNPDFLLRAEVLEAMEGGPLVLKVTLSYQGKGEKEVRQIGYGSNVFVEVPEGWHYRSRPYFIIGPAEITRTIAPGDQWSEVIFLHHKYSNIPSGKVKVRLSWFLGAADDKNALIAQPTAQLNLDVHPANKSQLAALRERLEKKMGRTDMAEEERRGLANLILFTNHRALVPVAMRMIESRDPGYPVWLLMEFAYGCSESPEELHPRLVKLVCDPAWGANLDVFEYWRSHRVSLPPREFRKLVDSPSVWTRALTYTTFGKKCDGAWVKCLLSELSELQKPVPADQFARLLNDLDDDRFEVRERATAELEALGARAESHLRRASKGPLPPEAGRRVRLILDKLTNEEASPECKRVLAYLDNFNAPEAAAILEALAKGSPGAWVTKEAKAHLAKRAESKP